MNEHSFSVKVKNSSQKKLTPNCRPTFGRLSANCWSGQYFNVIVFVNLTSLGLKKRNEESSKNTNVLIMCEKEID